METSRATAYIPLAELTHQTGQILEIYAETQTFGHSALDEKSLDRDWHFVAAELRKIGLYDDGLRVATAIRKMSATPPLWALYQRFKKQHSWLDNQRLHPGNNETEAVQNREGGSAQLGMALTLLLNGCDSAIRNVIATGELSSKIRTDDDVAIDPVSSVPEKLDLIIAKRQAGNFFPNQPLYCFTPTHYKKEKERLPVVDLSQIATLKALNIEVKPIAWLSEAAAILNARHTKPLPQDRWLGGAIIGLAALALAAGLYSAWWHQPIPVRFTPYRQYSHAFLDCTHSATNEHTFHALNYDGPTLLLPVFDTDNPHYNIGLGFSVTPQATLFSDQYYVALIHLEERIQPKVIVETKPVAADQPILKSWEMLERKKESKAQDNLLVLGFQRTPIDSKALNQKFQDWYKTQSANFSVAKQLIADQFPGFYTVNYKSIYPKEPPCP